MGLVEDCPVSDVSWQESYRIIPSRYPPIDLFERLADDQSESWILAEIEGVTNDRLRNEAGAIHLVPPEQRIFGHGASYVMAAFTHPPMNGSRFTDGSYGVFYTAREFETAVAETVFHMRNFYAATNDEPHLEDMRVLVGAVRNEFHDIRGEDPKWAVLVNPDDYSYAQVFAKQLRDANSNGIVYCSVRRLGGECLAAFKPTVVEIPKQGKHLQYEWSGTRISRYFDYEHDEWVEI